MSESSKELERVYTVPLSRAWIAARHRRTVRAVNILKEFAQRHMKTSDIKIETELNEELWKRGITNPPRRITVNMLKDEDGLVTISLPKPETPKEIPTEAEEVLAEAPISPEAPREEKQTSPEGKDATISKEKPKVSPRVEKKSVGKTIKKRSMTTVTKKKTAKKPKSRSNSN